MKKTGGDPVEAAEDVAFRLRQMLDLRPSEVDHKSFTWGMQLGIYALSYQTDMRNIVAVIETDKLPRITKLLVDDAGALSIAFLLVEAILAERAKD